MNLRRFLNIVNYQITGGNRSGVCKVKNDRVLAVQRARKWKIIAIAGCSGYLEMLDQRRIHNNVVINYKLGNNRSGWGR
jgi:hypothetical protein